MQINIQKESKKKTPHLAVCHETNPSANLRHTSLLMKASNTELTEDVIKALNKFGLENFPEDIQKAVTAMNKRSILETIIQDEFECEDDYGWNCTWLCDYDDTYAYFMRKCEMYRVTYKQDGVNFSIGDVAEPIVALTDYQVVDGELEISESAKDKLEDGVYAMLTKSLSDPEKSEKIKALVTGLQKSLESANVESDDINVNKSNTKTESPLEINQEILKSSEVQALIAAEIEKATKQQNDRIEQLEKARQDLIKAQEDQEKSQMLEVFKGYSFVTEEQANQLTESLFKSEASVLVMDVLEKAKEAMSSVVEKEAGVEAEVEVNTDLEKSKSRVAEILKSRKQKK